MGMIWKDPNGKRPSESRFMLEPPQLSNAFAKSRRFHLRAGSIRAKIRRTRELLADSANEKGKN
jgi:hypothetical protein